MVCYTISSTCAGPLSELITYEAISKVYTNSLLHLDLNFGPINGTICTNPYAYGITTC